MNTAAWCTEKKKKEIIAKARAKAKIGDIEPKSYWNKSRELKKREWSDKNHQCIPEEKVICMLSMLFMGYSHRYVSKWILVDRSTVAAHIKGYGISKEILDGYQSKDFTKSGLTYKQSEEKASKIIKLVSETWPLRHVVSETGISAPRVYKLLTTKHPLLYKDYTKKLRGKAFPRLLTSKEMDDKISKEIDILLGFGYRARRISKHFLECNEFKLEIKTGAIARYLDRLEKGAQKTKPSASSAPISPPKEASYEKSGEQEMMANTLQAVLAELKKVNAKVNKLEKEKKAGKDYRARYSKEFKKKVVSSVKKGGLSIAAAATKYGVSPSTVNLWKHELSSTRIYKKKEGKQKK